MAVSRFIKKRQEEYRALYGKVELKVMQITKDTFGGEVYKSTVDEDKKDHVDFWWDSPKKGKIGIDVKGIRKNDDGELDDTIFWIEYRNNPGLPGWIYGKEEYIAIERFTDIVYIKRDVLRKYAEEKLPKMEPVTKRPKEFFVPYTRSFWGHRDLTMKVPMSDIIQLVNEKGEDGTSNGFFAVF